MFAPRRAWQKFCKTPCRKTFHASMTPEVLRREIDELKKRVAELEHRPFDMLCPPPGAIEA
jgi:hypothetical protein